MNRVDALQMGIAPKNRGEQVDASVAFILDNPEFYTYLVFRAERVKAAAVELVRLGVSGYHFKIIKKALNDLKDGCLDSNAPPYTHEELYL